MPKKVLVPVLMIFFIILKCSPEDKQGQVTKIRLTQSSLSLQRLQQSSWRGRRCKLNLLHLLGRISVFIRKCGF